MPLGDLHGSARRLGGRPTGQIYAREERLSVCEAVDVTLVGGRTGYDAAAL